MDTVYTDYYTFLLTLCFCGGNSNEYVPSKDRPDIDIHIFADNPPDRFGGNISLSPSSRLLQQGNGHAVVLDVTEKGGLPWTHCDLSLIHISEPTRPP